MTGRLEQRFVALPSGTAERSGPGGHPCQGSYLAPSGRRPRFGVLACHPSVDFSEHYLGPLLAARGLGFLGWNTRYRGNDSTLLVDHALLDVAAGVRWLLEEARVEGVVLLGNSGGGTFLAAYQAQATAGILAPADDRPLAPGLDALPPGVAFVAVAAHLGRPDVLTAWLDPSVTDETDPSGTDPALDLWAEGRHPPFDPAFLARYRAAQEARNQRITAWATAERDRRRARGEGERLFLVPRTWADPRMVDASLDPSNRPVPACLAGDPRRANRSAFGLAACSTLRSWLSQWSLQTSPLRADRVLPHVGVPSLVVEADADTGVFPSDVRRFTELLGSADKDHQVLPGDHYFRQPADAREQLADRLVAWLAARFPI
jgi:hypothetical protein